MWEISVMCYTSIWPGNRISRQCLLCDIAMKTLLVDGMELEQVWYTTLSTELCDATSPLSQVGTTGMDFTKLLMLLYK